MRRGNTCMKDRRSVKPVLTIRRIPNVFCHRPVDKPLKSAQGSSSHPNSGLAPLTERSLHTPRAFTTRVSLV